MGESATETSRSLEGTCRRKLAPRIWRPGPIVGLENWQTPDKQGMCLARVREGMIGDSRAGPSSVIMERSQLLAKSCELFHELAFIAC
jgi:hypothetical protein